MPVFVVNTNVSQVPDNFKQLATDVIAKSLSKPVSYIAVQVNAKQDLCFGGTNEPAALCELTSIGALSVEANKRHSKALMDLLKQQLKVEPSRAYITFRNTASSDIGYSGTTFADLM